MFLTPMATSQVTFPGFKAVLEDSKPILLGISSQPPLVYHLLLATLATCLSRYDIVSTNQGGKLLPYLKGTRARGFPTVFFAAGLKQEQKQVIRMCVPIVSILVFFSNLAPINNSSWESKGAQSLFFGETWHWGGPLRVRPGATQDSSAQQITVPRIKKIRSYKYP